MRRKYQVSIYINQAHFLELIVDPHFEEKHGKSMDDKVILQLVKNLDGQIFSPIDVDRDGFRYFKTEPMFFKGNPYRLIWLIDPDETYIGVIKLF